MEFVKKNREWNLTEIKKLTEIKNITLFILNITSMRQVKLDMEKGSSDFISNQTGIKQPWDTWSDNDST